MKKSLHLSSTFWNFNCFKYICKYIQTHSKAKMENDMKLLLQNKGVHESDLRTPNPQD